MLGTDIDVRPRVPEGRGRYAVGARHAALVGRRVVRLGARARRRAGAGDLRRLHRQPLAARGVRRGRLRLLPVSHDGARSWRRRSSTRPTNGCPPPTSSSGSTGCATSRAPSADDGRARLARGARACARGRRLLRARRCGRAGLRRLPRLRRTAPVARRGTAGAVPLPAVAYTLEPPRARARRLRDRRLAGDVERERLRGRGRRRARGDRRRRRLPGEPRAASVRRLRRRSGGARACARAAASARARSAGGRRLGDRLGIARAPALAARVARSARRRSRARAPPACRSSRQRTPPST